VLLYADKMTDSMQKAIDETSRRRRIQEEYNAEHGITPETIRKNIRTGIEQAIAAHREANAAVGRGNDAVYITEEYIQELEAEMMSAAESLEFERAASIRDRIMKLRDSVGETVSQKELEQPAKKRRGYRGGKFGAKVPRPKMP
jgi:excinuclease ABC subunit B